jgi:small subunit ribosomal protein S6
MRKSYELTFVVRNEPNDDAINAIINQVQAWVEVDNLGQVTKINRWGRRRLAYEINRQRDGYYVVMNADMDTQNHAELNRNMKLSPDILRYLLIVPDHQKEKEEAPKKEEVPQVEASQAEASQVEVPQEEAPKEAEAPQAEA